MLEQQERLLEYLKISSVSHKIFKSIKDEESNLKDFLSLRSEDKLDCLYRLDFFRRPNIIFEILNIISLLYKAFEIMNSIDEDIKKFLDLFADELNQLKSEVDLSNSGEEIKKLIYQERLSVLKRIS
jgi:hypothetical protein